MDELPEESITIEGWTHIPIYINKEPEVNVYVDGFRLTKGRFGPLLLKIRKWIFYKLLRWDLQSKEGE